MAVCQTQQDLSIDAFRYLQLVTANHVLILLRRDSCWRQMTEIAAHFTQIRESHVVRSESTNQDLLLSLTECQSWTRRLALSCCRHASKLLPSLLSKPPKPQDVFALK
jgi:hypothetical protein